MTIAEMTETAESQPKRSRRTVFSGIQPSGDVHLGNYLGAIKGWAERQAEKENFFCVVDLHAITVPQDPAVLAHQTRSVSAMLLAAGIDPAKSTLFVQSHVTAHAEACWILNCVTPVGWLERMTQYKDKTARQESVTTGLLDYPVLMAGDILLYDADEVPVGDDQRPARRARTGHRPEVQPPLRRHLRRPGGHDPGGRRPGNGAGRPDGEDVQERVFRQGTLRAAARQPG